MITIYTLDEYGVFAGAVQHDPLLPLPRCTLTPPPSTEDGEVAVFNGAAWTVLTDYPATTSLAQLKAAKNAEINAARLAANFSTFTHAGKAIACDQLSRSDIDGTNGFVALYSTLPPGWPGGWKAVDNTYVAIADVAAWKAFYSSMFAAGNANFAKAQTLKAQLDAATTAAQVSAIEW